VFQYRLEDRGRRSKPPFFRYVSRKRPVGIVAGRGQVRLSWPNQTEMAALPQGGVCIECLRVVCNRVVVRRFVSSGR